MKKKQPKKASKKAAPRKVGVVSLKKQKALRDKVNAQRRRNTLKKKINSLLELPSDQKIKGYYFVKKGNKKIKLTTTNTANYFINNLLNQTTKESGTINRINYKYGKKQKVKKTIELKKQLKLNFNAWQRKDILNKIKEFKSKKAINSSTGETNNLKNDFASFVISLSGELTNVDSAQSLSLFFDFKNNVVTYGIDKNIEDIEEIED